MDSNPTKRMSRRDAMKILGAAAGASVLAGLPSKWSKPELAAGALPAHAQTTGVSHTLKCAALVITPPPGPAPSPNPPNLPITSKVTISPPDPGIDMHYQIAPTGMVTIDPLNGIVPTDALGQAEVLFHVAAVGSPPHSVTVTWKFVDSALSPDTCSATKEILPP